MKTNLFCKIACQLILSILLTGNFSAQTTKVNGKLLDVNGKPSKDAFVGIVETPGARGKNFVGTDNKGNYFLSISNPGISYLIFSIPSHSAIQIPVINTKDKEIRIDVQLSPYKYKTTFDDVSIAGSFNSFNISSPEKMTKLDNGTFVFETKTDLKEIKYQLCKIEENNRTINAPESVQFEPDSTGDYRSVMKVENGVAKITFDPSNLLRSDKPNKVEFVNADLEERFYLYSAEVGKQILAASKKLMEHMTNNKNNIESFHYDAGNYLTDLIEKIESEKNEDAKNYLKLNYVSFRQYRAKNYDFEKAENFYTSVPVDNIAWDLVPNAFSAYFTLFPRHKWDKIQDDFLNYSKNKNIRLYIFQSKLANAKFANNTEELMKLHAMIKNDYPDLKEAQDMLKRYQVESKIQIGEEIPDFEVTSIDNSKIKYSKKSMLGKIYLIDFWATWCGPCVGEMENLHNAYKNFKDKGFEILSLSLDSAVNDVIKFRNGQWKMPWLNSFIGDAEGRKIADKFEVIGIPKPLLISAEGKILETEMNLRGMSLENTLKKYFP
ncbi:MAG: TlpA family protein disulfide reductase [Ignavibacteria bacterium]|nr:TlpA family protein disulfide reductase [Ignavibacteria bacterium]